MKMKLNASLSAAVECILDCWLSWERLGEIGERGKGGEKKRFYEMMDNDWIGKEISREHSPLKQCFLNKGSWNIPGEG